MGSRTLAGFAAVWISAVFFLAADLPFPAEALSASSKKSWNRGKLLYVERCILCHGEEGRGWDMRAKIARPPVAVPDLTESSFMRGFTDKDLFRVIKEGGTRQGKSRFMPPAGRWLSDDEIRDVITYLRSLERSGPAAGGGRR